MQTIYHCGDYAYRSERAAIALTAPTARRKIARISLQSKRANPESFFLVHYAAGVAPNKPEATTEISQVQQVYIEMGLVKRIALMTWEVDCYVPTAMVTPLD